LKNLGTSLQSIHYPGATPGSFNNYHYRHFLTDFLNKDIYIYFTWTAQLTDERHIPMFLMGYGGPS